MSVSDCRNGNHNLTEIYRRTIYYESDDVVRWCTQCGAVVIDIDIDGRISPGSILKMKIPEDLNEMQFKQNN